ncbi:type 2 lanthipeptide synthetase LanM [Streptomyces sp. NBC_01190]|uniref:type 2 lanthipeptide synthetase LanM n=1 Tax=Streptomyces sp. NBC_01190 TaxID=2903767 RepID=UPI003867FB75|nr:type 2 lanthipeptide synthetase LanM family protein [Streptomyces sp. NBC_01190]
MVSKNGSNAARPLVMPWERRGRPALTGAWWARALRLDERCAADWPDAERPEDFDAAAVADIRMQRWRDAFAHLAADTLDRQTAAYGCTPRQLRGLLAEPAEQLARRVPKPAWAADVERVAALAQDGPAPGQPCPEDAGAPDGSWQQGFALIVEPFVREALRDFDARTDPGRRPSDDPLTADEIRTTGDPGATGVSATDRPADRPADRATERAAVRAAVRHEATRRLVRLATRVLVLELNVLRVTGALDGSSPEERFGSFVRHFRRPAGLAALLDEYAVLARLSIATAGRIAAAHAEFLDRLARDRPALRADLFGGADPGPLASLDLGRGDTHAGGRSVGIALFASGARAVYKPRPMAVHRHFNEVVDGYNARLPADLRLRTVAVVDRGHHGWVEFVDAEPCEDAAAAHRYFRRQGALLALLHCLAGVDFHFENLIAAGDQPVPIDLETLLCADLPRSFGSPTRDADPAARAYRESVGRVGLLPSVVVGADGQAFDAGGMGGDTDAALPYRVADWTGGGTDAMRMERVTPVLRAGQNRPRLDGADLDGVRYAAELQDGYRAGYRALADGAGEFPAPDRFAADTVRIIPRATHEYATLLTETTHPDVLRDALDRDQVFGVLWARAATDPVRARLTRHEVADLWAGDVPLFTAAAGAREVRAADLTSVGDLLPESGVERVRRTLAAMDGRHLTDQQWIISAQLATRVTGAAPGASDADPAGPADGADLPGRALAAARDVAGQLAAAACRGGGRIGWLGLDLWEDARWSVQPLGVDLYNGYAGVALFLAQLAHVTGEQRYAELARGALAPVAGCAREVLDGLGPQDAAGVVGAFTGTAGMAYALAACGELLDDDAARAVVAPLLDLVARPVSPAAGYDVIGGTAGCLALAEALSARYGPAAHTLAERCAEVLVAGAAPAGDGLGWSGAGARPLLGFSHGAAGIGWALLAYARRTGDEAAAAAGRGAFAYEHGAYDEESGNWPDHRKPEPSSQHSWCHGAPGVGLARAAALAADPGRPALGSDLRRALESTGAFGRHRNHSLCHGELGNLELFAAAGKLAVPGAHEAWRHRAAAVVARIERDGPLCGTPGGIATPGLMTGLSGIGHGLLRIAAPDRVAPVLLLPSV